MSSASTPTLECLRGREPLTHRVAFVEDVMYSGETSWRYAVSGHIAVGWVKEHGDCPRLAGKSGAIGIPIRVFMNLRYTPHMKLVARSFYDAQ